MKKVLVLGGTRFFGKKLVNLLIDDAEVTIANRGITADAFGNRVTRIQFDRENYASLHSTVGSSDWDIIYDNICYSPQAAQDAVEIFKGRVNRYLFTSTMSVYEQGNRRICESEFDPFIYPIQLGNREDFTYAEGKRLAEAVFFQRASFPVCAVRFPVVLGSDDYTQRLKFHIDRVRDGKLIGIPNIAAVMSYISSDEAAKFLEWLGNQEMQGVVNACSAGEFSLKDILTLIEEAVGKAAITESDTQSKDLSPLAIADAWYMDTSKAVEAGYSFQHITTWFPNLVKELTLNEG